MSSSSHAAAPARLRALVAATAGAGLIAWVGAFWGVMHQPQLSPAVLLLLMAAVPLSERALLHVRFGGQQYSFTWGEACLLLGFVLATPAWFVVLAGPLVLMVHLSAGRSLMKAGFNAACFVVAGAAAGLLLQVLGRAPYGLGTVREGVALVLATCLFSLVSAVLTAAAVAASSGGSLPAVLLGSGRMSVVVWAGNVSGAGGVLALAERGTVVLWVLPPLLGLVGLGYRAYLSATTEREAWQQLEASTRELNRLDEHEIALAALTRARLMFRTHDVSLVLDAHGELAARAYVLDQAGRLVRCAGPVERSRYGATLLSDAGHAKVRGVEAPLLGPTGSLGSLELAFNAPVSLSARERQVLSTFSHAVATTLLNAYLYEDMRAEAARQAHQASHDPLTGLANRVLLASRTSAALAQADQVTALLLLDLDHFKEINDTLGHAAGRRAPAGGRRAAAPVGRPGRPGGTTGRRRVRDPPHRSGRTRATPSRSRSGCCRLLAAAGGVRGPAAVGRGQPRASPATRWTRVRRRSCSVVATSRCTRPRPSAGRGCGTTRCGTTPRCSGWPSSASCAPPSPTSWSSTTSRRSTWHRVSCWVRRRSCAGSTRSAVCCSPGAFIGVAEQSGLVRPFTLRVLELAVAECATWQDRGSPAVGRGEPRRPRPCWTGSCPTTSPLSLARHGLPPHRLVLEITETTATSELEVVEEVLGRLRRLGVEISVDDFGTGFSSLAFLQRTSVHELKVDRSFVSGMLVNDSDLALVRATVSLAHSLGARAVAEGVESQALQVALASLGCDVAQGYHLGRPMPAEQLRALLPAPVAHNLPAPRVSPDRHLSAVREA